MRIRALEEVVEILRKNALVTEKLLRENDVTKIKEIMEDGNKIKEFIKVYRRKTEEVLVEVDDLFS